MASTLGIDIGGTKIAGAVVDDDGRIGARLSVPTPTEGTEPLLTAIAAVVEHLRTPQTDSAGLSVAGFVDAARSGVYFAPNLPLRDIALHAEITRRTGLATVIENDGNAAAWAEFRFGAGRDAQHMLMVAVGTGVGGGLVLDGRLQRGGHGVAGEIGHLRAVPGGLPCPCGRLGCLEQYASGSALQRNARQAVAGDPQAGRALLAVAGGDPQALLGPQVTEVAATGDPLATALVAEVGRHLGEGIADLVAVLDPEVIVLGGGVAESGELLAGPVRQALAANLTGAGHRPFGVVRTALLGNGAAIVGAADLARQA
ncbi:ROK family protein [Nocardioides dubius]|uniref:ROK family glucokinase n=1 Tax=Nocardioides dubius TaxID=317019 RepID=A0ABP4E6Z4_9ACTN